MEKCGLLTKTVHINFVYVVFLVMTLASFGACYMSYNAGMKDGFKKGVSDKQQLVNKKHS